MYCFIDATGHGYNYISDNKVLGSLTRSEVEEYVDSEILVKVSDGKFMDINDYLGDDVCTNVRMNNHQGF